MNKRTKLMCGVGINDADYEVQQFQTVNGKRRQVWRCPFYSRWKNMLARCYSDKYQSGYPTYIGCSVCDEWLIFSNFKSWMEAQEWEDCHLDKDLLIEGNKVYSPECCIFVHRKVNLFTTDRSNDRGEYMLGVHLHKANSKFVSQCSNPFTGENEYLGLFDNELDGHLAWKKRKHELACQLADSELVSDPRLAKSLKTRYK